jgi:hypothetical protein
MCAPLKKRLNTLVFPPLLAQSKGGRFFVAIRCSGDSLYQSEEKGVLVAR